MRYTLTRCLGFLVGLVLLAGPFLGSFTFAQPNFGGALEDSVDTATNGNGIDLINNLQQRTITGGTEGTGLRDFIVWIATEIVLPMIVLAGIIIAIIGFYKLMAAKSDDDLQSANNYILRGTVGVIIMVSAGYMVNALGGTEGVTGIFGVIGISNNPIQSGANVADQLYVNLVFPFIKIALFFILGILYILAVIAGFRYIFNADGESQKKSIMTLVWTTLGIIVIILAKEIVEGIYGTYADVVNTSADDLGQIGNGFFEVTDFPLLFRSINWLLGLVMFLIVIIIVFQGFQLLTQPTNEEAMSKLKKNMGYVFIGIIVIGAAYLLSNFFIIK